jgi:hypothetical protein
MRRRAKIHWYLKMMMRARVLLMMRAWVITLMMRA